MKKLALAIICLCTSISANASLTWKLTGEVETVGEPLSHIFSVGDSVEYVFTFDPLTPDSNPSAVWGSYVNSISSATITVGSYTATIENYGIELINDSNWGQPEDLISFHLNSTSTILNGNDLLGSDNWVYKFSGIEGSIQDKDGFPNMLLSDSLPITSQLINENATWKTFYVAWTTPMYGGAGLMNGISATNIQLTDITPVPVPAAAWLLGSGLLGLIGFARKK